MKMKKFIFVILITSFTLFGCTKQEEIKNDEYKETSLQSSQTQEQNREKYNSISNYLEEVKGPNFQTGVLKITKKNNIVFLNMDFALSSDLERKMLNTKEPFYFYFTAIDGKDSINKEILDKSHYNIGDLKNLISKKDYHLTQQIEINPKISKSIIKEILSPENYQLEIYNENGQLVAVIIGLAYSAIQR